MKLSDMQTPTEGEIDDALSQGLDVWHLESAGADSNDFFVGARDAVVAEVLARHCPDRGVWPDGWLLTQVDQAAWTALRRA